MTTFKPKLISSAIAAALLAGCASLEQFSTQVTEKTETAVRVAKAEKEVPVTVRTDPGIHIAATPVEYVPPTKGMVTLRASDVALAGTIRGIADGSGYSVSYQMGVDHARPISVDLRDAEPQAAIREIAYTAGYVAVFDKPKSVTIAREASLTFRVPARVMKTLRASYSVTNSAQSPGGTVPTAGSATAGSAGSAGGALNTSGTNGNTSTISVTGTSNQDVAGLRTFLAGLSGAEVNVLSEEGLIAARGNATQLRRIQAFLDQFVRDSLAQIEVELSVVEVSLTSEFQTGIDWQRVIPPDSIFGNALGSIRLTAGPAIPTDSFTVQSTSRSIDSVVKALEQFSSINELTRPRVVTMNHAQTVYRASIQRPYLPTASSNVISGGGGNTVQNSASVSYSEDGVTFMVQAHVIDAHRVELTLVPVITATQSIDRFPVSRDVTLSAPVQPRQDAFLQVLAEHGKTMVLGGLRSSSGTDRVSGIPGAVRVPGLNLVLGGHNDRTSAREVVMLLHTRIVPAARVSTLIGESV